MRKLTVKNFSVIKDAELEFGKITVLIGPQSSGKSLLCKLAYFFSKHTIDGAVESLISGDSLQEFKKKISYRFVEWFPIEVWENVGATARFESGSFVVEVNTSLLADNKCEFSLQFAELYSQLGGIRHELAGFGSDFSSDRREQLRGRLNLMLTDGGSGQPFVHQSLYVPGSRVLFTNSSLGFSALQNSDIDPVVREFAPRIAWGDSWRLNPVIGPLNYGRLEGIRQAMILTAGGEVEGRNTNAKFRRSSDGKGVPLTLLSSGTQELLPMFNVLEQMISGQRDRILFPRPNSFSGMQDNLVLSRGLIYVEEPESSVFPETQYKLVRLFAWLSNDPSLDFSWVITTHSPYLLSSFNNLIEAGQVIRDHPALGEEVAKIISRQYWIKEGDFKAYSIQDGELKSILSEIGMIEGNYLDQVSEVIGNEFDQLLRLEYDHSEA